MCFTFVMTLVGIFCHVDLYNGLMPNSQIATSFKPQILFL